MSRFLSIALDPECLRQAASGDRSAQREVYEAVAAPMFALIRRLVTNRAAAEDVFQDCMMGLLAHVGDYRGEAPFGAWVRQLTLRRCLTHLRSPWQRARSAWHAVLPGEEDGRTTAVPLAGAALWADPLLVEQIDLERALTRLPETARAVVWMHDVEGMKHEEIGTAFGRTPSFSKSQLSRAHALLRAELIDHQPEVRALPADGLAAQGHLP